VRRHDPVNGSRTDSSLRGSPPRVAIVHATGARVEPLAGVLTRAGMTVTDLLPLARAAEIAGLAPSAVVLVADLDRLESLTAMRAVQRAAPVTPIVAVACDETQVLARRALNAGAAAFVSEALAPTALAAAVMAVIAGLICVPPCSRRLVARPTFSHREREVLQLMLAGMTNREIADRLHLAESTAKGHLVTAFSKLGVRSRKEAAATLLDPAEGLLAHALPPSVGAVAPHERARSHIPGSARQPAIAPAVSSASR
jgi:DNA-binding NarL/FixJ family response regulator